MPDAHGDEDSLGLGPEEPRDRQVDREFTARWDAFVRRYYSPRQRLLRWWRSGPLGALLRGGAAASTRGPARGRRGLIPVPPQPGSAGASPGAAGSLGSRGPPPHDCALAALAYLLPLAGGLRAARPLLAVCPVLDAVCFPLTLLSSPVASPLGASLVAAWLLCGVGDRNTVESYFVRYNFCQALLLGALMLLLALPRALPLLRLGWQGVETGLMGSFVDDGVRPALPHLILSGCALGISVVAWAWSSACCLQGRFPDRIPIISAAASRQVKW